MLGEVREARCAHPHYILLRGMREFEMQDDERKTEITRAAPS